MLYAAVLDANVLHPIVTTEILLRLADRGLFRPVWSREILDEVQRSLERRGRDPAKIERRIRVMETYFPDSMAEDVARFLPAVPEQVEHGDRHVVAAALAGKADAIVTNNLDDFPAGAVAALAIEIQSLDAFLLNQWSLDPAAVREVLAEIEQDLRQPPMTLVDVLDGLALHAPEFASILRRELLS